MYPYIAAIPVISQYSPFFPCHRYAEYIAVPEVQYLIKVPENMSLSTAAMLPSGALWAMNTVFSAHKHVEKVLAEKGETGQWWW